MSDPTTTVHRNGPLFRLPRLEVVGAFGVAAAMLFGFLFSVSTAVMNPPRDVRLSVDESLTPRATRQGLALEHMDGRNVR